MQSKTIQEGEFFSPGLRFFIVALLFVAAFAVRVYHIDKFPANLSPGRPIHSLLIARGYYFEGLKSIPEWRRESARINKERCGTGEPHIMEPIAAFAFRIAGGEYLWIPRLISSIFWLIGGAFLYLLVKKIASADAALLSIAFYLFLPYGVSASRTLMPHPLMIMMLVLSLFCIFRYYEQRSIQRLIIAAALSSMAMLTYPSASFPVYGAFVALAFYKDGISKAVISPKSLLFAAITVLPVGIYYAYNYFFGPYLSHHVEVSLTPSILLRSFFWRGWFSRIEATVGFAATISGLFGVFLFRKGSARVLAIGLWVSYFVYALIFNYHNATHTYYQIVFIPTVAISLGSIGVLIANRLSKTCDQLHWRVSVLIVIVLAVSLSMYRVRRKMHNPNFQNQIKIAQEVGKMVGHSTKTILLTQIYHLTFKYFGELSGENWPARGDFVAMAMRGEPMLAAQQRFNTLYLKNDPEYFIITNFREFMSQTDLKNFLVENFPVLVQTNYCLIFDLRKNLKKVSLTNN